MPGNTAPSIQSSQSGNRPSHAAPRGFRCGRSEERLASEAKFKVMRGIANNGYAIYGNRVQFSLADIGSC